MSNAASSHRTKPSAQNRLGLALLCSLFISCARTPPPEATPAAEAPPNPEPPANPSSDSPTEAKPADPAENDEFAWLENVDGDQALDWVRARNQHTANKLTSTPLYSALYADALEVLNSKSRIPGVTIRGQYLYNFWRDEAHPRGIYRRTTLRQYRKAKPKWETVLDIDALSKHEGKKWVFKGMNCLREGYRKCLVYLSPGGQDAVEIREFDSHTLKFVDSGFRVPKAKTSVTWLDADTLIIGTDFGPGTLTPSKYPRQLKRWQRGTPLSEATPVFEAPKPDGRVSARRLRTEGRPLVILRETISFWERNYYQLEAGQVTKLTLPASANLDGAAGGRLVISLKNPWTIAGRTYTEGSILLAKPEALHGENPELEVLLQPTAREVVQSVHADDKAIVVTYLDEVRGRVDRFTKKADAWQRQHLKFPDNGSISVASIDDDSGAMFVHYESFTSPASLYYVSGPKWKPQQLKAQASTFDGSRFASHQYWAQSKDGTRVPYFVVMAKDTELNGKNPTHIFGYGGFRVALTPSYSGSYEALSGAYGKLWLERGGVFVLANLRGGGEFGPKWHAGVLRENRPRVYEDLEAIAVDLVGRGITSPQHLGIEGRSNGGLLVAAAMTRRPELYGAVICGVPLTDMRRYHKLLAGELWIAEYGNPDVPADWAFLQTYSPYHNLAAERSYPEIMFYTSTRDDRVHPAHARKMAARMLKLGHDVDYYENIEGGHGGSSTNEQLAHRIALTYTHLWRHLGANTDH